MAQVIEIEIRRMAYILALTGKKPTIARLPSCNLRGLFV
jgi:hypothetical protein